LILKSVNTFGHRNTVRRIAKQYRTSKIKVRNTWRCSNIADNQATRRNEVVDIIESLLVIKCNLCNNAALTINSKKKKRNSYFGGFSKVRKFQTRKKEN
jgi:hypothetical protein